jgi:hypothetical protein
LPTPSHEDRAGPSPFTTAGAAVITGAAALAGATDGVDEAGKSVAEDPVSAGVEAGGEDANDEAGKSVAGDPVSAGVEVEGEDANDDDPVPEPLPNAEVSTGC